MKKSAAEIIRDQASRIAELERGLGDIVLLLNDPTHTSIKNSDGMVQLIMNKIKAKVGEEDK